MFHVDADLSGIGWYRVTWAGYKTQRIHSRRGDHLDQVWRTKLCCVEINAHRTHKRHKPSIDPHSERVYTNTLSKNIRLPIFHLVCEIQCCLHLIPALRLNPWSLVDALCGKQQLIQDKELRGERQWITQTRCGCGWLICHDSQRWQRSAFLLSVVTYAINNNRSMSFCFPHNTFNKAWRIYSQHWDQAVADVIFKDMVRKCSPDILDTPGISKCNSLPWGSSETQKGFWIDAPKTNHHEVHPVYHHIHCTEWLLLYYPVLLSETVFSHALSI